VSSEPAIAPEDLSQGQLLEQVREKFARQDFEGVDELTEELTSRVLEADAHQEALYYSGEALYALEERKDAFRSYQTLLEDYPYSDYLPAVQKHVFEIGEFYLAGEMSVVFKDLFSGRPFGVEVMREFAVAYPFSDLADDALERVAAYHFSRAEYDLASARYQHVVDDHPDSEWADLAAYRIGLCHFLSSRGSGYDRTPLRDAARAFRQYLASSRPRAFVAEAEAHLTESEEMLAEGELMVAELYLLREQDRGARIHLANCVLAYPATEAAERARLQLERHGWDLTMHSLDTIVPSGREGAGAGRGR
jgi:outer membrane protein assembly factor BamD (BamD/ComL family)